VNTIHPNTYDIISESLIFNRDNLAYNLDKWKHGDINTLFITGYLGSGKTTITHKLAQQYHCNYIELDSYRENEIAKLCKKLNITKLSDDKSSELWDIAFKKLENKVKNQKTKLIIEGIDVIFMDKKIIFDSAILITNTTKFVSNIRAVFRNIKYKEDTGYRNSNPLTIIKDTLYNQNKFESHIKQFINEMKLKIKQLKK